MSKTKEMEELRQLERYVRDLTKDMDVKLADLKVQVSEIQQRATRKFARRPMLALGVAFVVGMAFGVALSKSSD